MVEAKLQGMHGQPTSGNHRECKEARSDKHVGSERGTSGVPMTSRGITCPCATACLLQSHACCFFTCNLTLHTSAVILTVLDIKITKECSEGR